jgi:cytochrome c556
MLGSPARHGIDIPTQKLVLIVAALLVREVLRIRVAVTSLHRAAHWVRVRQPRRMCHGTVELADLQEHVRSFAVAGGAYHAHVCPRLTGPEGRIKVRLGVLVLLGPLCLAMALAPLLPRRSASAAPSDREPPRRELPAPDYLGPAARAQLSARMARHGSAMMNLVRAVTLLDHRTTAALAQQIVDEEMVARTSGGSPGGLEATLPEEFFAHQDRLRSEARRLAEVAQREDVAALAESFGKVAARCVACHQTFLRGQSQRPR